MCHAGQRSHEHQLAFTKYKELASGLPFLRRKAFSFLDATILYSVTVSSPLSLHLLDSSKLGINREKPFRKRVSVQLFTVYPGTKYLE